MKASAAIMIGSIMLLTQVTPGAAGVNDDVASCRAAMTADPEFAGIAPDAKFERYREGRIRTVRFALKSHNGGHNRLIFCRIEKGGVVSLVIRAQ